MTDESLAQIAQAQEHKPASVTPLRELPGIDAEEIATACAGFRPAAPPVLTPGSPVLETSVAQLAALAKSNPGRQIRVTQSDTSKTALMYDAVDVEILIPDNVQVGMIQLDDRCSRVRVRGEGPNSRLHSARVSGASDSTFHSLLMRGSEASSAMQIGSATGPVAFISCIAGSTGASSFDVSLHSKAQDVLIADCNMGSDGNEGVNDWCLRFGDTSRVVMVDCFCEARGKQPVLRRTGGSSHFLFKRVTTYNSRYAQTIADVGDGRDLIQRDFFLADCVSYVGGSSGLRFGGYSMGPTHHSAVWRVRNHTFYSVNKRVDADLLAGLEGQAYGRGDWKYRLGSPRFQRWDGKTHPGWPQRIGLHGKPMAILDPYAL